MLSIRLQNEKLPLGALLKALMIFATDVYLGEWNESQQVVS